MTWSAETAETVDAPEPPPTAQPDDLLFAHVYEQHFDFVWRNLRRLGVPDAHIDDATQDVFLVVHRKLSEFAGRSSVRTWVFGILFRVAADHRRALRRKRGDAQSRAGDIDVQLLADERNQTPHDRFVQREAVDFLHRLLESLEDEQRAMLVMIELEQLSVPEAAQALGLRLNTAYARLRAARQAFERAVKRARSQSPGGMP